MKSKKQEKRDKALLTPLETATSMCLIGAASVILMWGIYWLMPDLFAPLYPYDKGAICMIAFFAAMMAGTHLEKSYALQKGRPLVSQAERMEHVRKTPLKIKFPMLVFGWGIPVGMVITSAIAMEYGFFTLSFSMIYQLLAAAVGFAALCVGADYLTVLVKRHFPRKS